GAPLSPVTQPTGTELQPSHPRQASSDASTLRVPCRNCPPLRPSLHLPISTPSPLPLAIAPLRGGIPEHSASRSVLAPRIRILAAPLPLPRSHRNLAVLRPSRDLIPSVTLPYSFRF
ncbi:hypothetical protein M758_3G097100, partial [Ceratodon purpureus]